MSTIARFSWDHLLAFRAASLDSNPLHTDTEYAARTHFGGPVVFGVLCGLRALAEVPVPAGQTLSELAMEFRGAAFPDVDYQVTQRSRGGRVEAMLQDGPRLLTRVDPRFQPGRAPNAPNQGDGSATRATPRRGPIPPAGETLAGSWTPPWTAIRELCSETGLDDAGFSPVHAALAALSSYLVGMEVPGEQALFWRLKLQLPDPRPAAPGPWQTTIGVDSVDERFGLIRASFTVRDADGELAHGTVDAFERLRPARAALATDAVAATPQLPESRAWVIGASRGLGAALVRGLAAQGAHVVGSFRSDTGGAAAVASGLPSVEMRQGDGADRASCAETVLAITEARGGLDLLVLNASPPLRPLTLSPTAVDRMQSHIQRALALVMEPLAAALPALESAGGTVVLVSSSAVDTPTAEWPHYVAAKGAAEALVRTAAVAHPGVRFVIVRPPRLATGFTHNATLAEALDPATVVRVLVKALTAERPGGVEVLTAFEA
jgi:NAD(P)-dependent dehydrogenase (short-subunit alcohol dehydrogenase family)